LRLDQLILVDKYIQNADNNTTCGHGIIMDYIVYIVQETSLPAIVNCKLDVIQASSIHTRPADV
jgi:hypothetical protein